MNCHIAESMVNKYINHTLTLDELDAFLNHIEGCPSCYDELETYYIVHAAMQHLNLDEPESVMDFQTLLKQELRKAKRHVRNKKIARRIGIIAISLIAAALIGIIVFAIYEIKQFL